jgi:ATP-dependent protease ClpP protease subunit
MQRREAEDAASDFRNNVYRLRGPIDEGSVTGCIFYLTRWARLNPEADITLVINSPGGYVTEGMDLFDTILEMREAGHYITGVGRGYVASMGSILLQACDWRVMGPGCAMLVHEPSGMAMGSIGEIADAKAWLDMTANRILDIYAQRCSESGAEEPFTRTKLKNGWNRKNWWLSADECLKGGLIDEIR